jgi:hypothetical protein
MTIEETRTKEPKVELTVKVTEHHIARGIREDSRLCPVALALIQALGHKEVMVGLHAIWVNDQIYNLDADTIKYIKDFDKGFKTSPTTLEFCLLP